MSQSTGRIKLPPKTLESARRNSAVLRPLCEQFRANPGAFIESTKGPAEENKPKEFFKRPPQAAIDALVDLLDDLEVLDEFLWKLMANSIHSATSKVLATVDDVLGARIAKPPNFFGELLISVAFSFNWLGTGVIQGAKLLAPTLKKRRMGESVDEGLAKLLANPDLDFGKVAEPGWLEVLAATLADDERNKVAASLLKHLDKPFYNQVKRKAGQGVSTRDDVVRYLLDDVAYQIAESKSASKQLKRQIRKFEQRYRDRKLAELQGGDSVTDEGEMTFAVLSWIAQPLLDRELGAPLQKQFDSFRERYQKKLVQVLWAWYIGMPMRHVTVMEYLKGIWDVMKETDLVKFAKAQREVVERGDVARREEQVKKRLENETKLLEAMAKALWMKYKQRETTVFSAAASEFPMDLGGALKASRYLKRPVYGHRQPHLSRVDDARNHWMRVHVFKRLREGQKELATTGRELLEALQKVSKQQKKK